MKHWFLTILFALLAGGTMAQTPKIIQRDLDPQQRKGSKSGRITRIEYTRHKMIVYFESGNSDHATLYGPGHANSWRLYDTKTGKEYALLSIRNIKIDGEVMIPVLDKPRGEDFFYIEHLSCEAHFERPGQGSKEVDMIEEGIEQYQRQTPMGGFSGQWPYNIYDIRVLPYTDDMHNSKPVPVKSPARPPAKKPISGTKLPVKKAVPAAKPPVKKPVPAAKPRTPATVPPETRPKNPPQSAPRRDTILAKAPRVEAPAPVPAGPKNSIENFGSTVEAGRTYRLSNLLFKQSDYHIQPSSYPELDTLVSMLQRNPTMEIELAGHTDNVGDHRLNVALSRQRVDAVKSYLSNAGIQPVRIKIKAYGGSKPIADNSKEETRRLNRRVEVTFLQQ